MKFNEILKLYGVYYKLHTINSVSFNNLFGTFRNYSYEPLIPSYLLKTNDETLKKKDKLSMTS